MRAETVELICSQKPQQDKSRTKTNLAGVQQIACNFGDTHGQADITLAACRLAGAQDMGRRSNKHDDNIMS